MWFHGYFNCQDIDSITILTIIQLCINSQDMHFQINSIALQIEATFQSIYLLLLSTF